MGAVTIAALVAAVAGPLVAYITASRQLSQTAKTSDFTALSEAQDAIRVDYRAQVADLRIELANAVDRERRLHERIKALEETVTSLREEMRQR